MSQLTRRGLLQGSCAALAAATSGCLRSTNGSAAIDLVWGELGIRRGQFQRPRAITIDARDQLYIVDMTGRIQVFDADGKFLRNWRTPSIDNGKPSGLSLDQQGRLLVADTHYFQILVYDGDPRPCWVLGGNCGTGPGEFNFVTDAVQDRQGAYYVSEYGDLDRIQKFSPEGDFVCEWGGSGSGPGQMQRPNNLVLDDDDQLWVADSCNHRIQVFDIRPTPPKLVCEWGSYGTEPGRLNYPYDVILDGQGHVYVCEFGNERLQRFSLDGEFQAVIGGPGTGKGQFFQPWGAAFDSRGRLHILDSYNHRIQRAIV